MGASYNRYSDIAASLTVHTNGDDGTTTFTGGSAVVLNFDSIDVDDSIDTIKSQGGQDAIAINRLGVEEFAITVNTKWGAGFLRPVNGKKATLAIVPGLTYKGILSKVTTNYKDDSTLSFILSSYGVAPS